MAKDKNTGKDSEKKPAKQGKNVGAVFSLELDDGAPATENEEEAAAESDESSSASPEEWKPLDVPGAEERRAVKLSPSTNHPPPSSFNDPDVMQAAQLQEKFEMIMNRRAKKDRILEESGAKTLGQSTGEPSGETENKDSSGDTETKDQSNDGDETSSTSNTSGASAPIPTEPSTSRYTGTKPKTKKPAPKKPEPPAQTPAAASNQGTAHPVVYPGGARPKIRGASGPPPTLVLREAPTNPQTAETSSSNNTISFIPIKKKTPKKPTTKPTSALAGTVSPVSEHVITESPCEWQLETINLSAEKSPGAQTRGGRDEKQPRFRTWPGPPLWTLSKQTNSPKKEDEVEGAVAIPTTKANAERKRWSSARAAARSPPPLERNPLERSNLLNVELPGQQQQADGANDVEPQMSEEERRRNEAELKQHQESGKVFTLRLKTENQQPDEETLKAYNVALEAALVVTKKSLVVTNKDRQRHVAGEETTIPQTKGRKSKGAGAVSDEEDGGATGGNNDGKDPKSDDKGDKPDKDDQDEMQFKMDDLDDK